MSDKKLVNKVLEVSWHRNGVGGRGFYAVRFLGDIETTTPEEAKMWNFDASGEIKDAKWLAILTDDPGECYVICTDLLETRGVRFGRNSWRGDRYEPELRAAIKATNDETSGAVRAGPFGLPT